MSHHCIADQLRKENRPCHSTSWLQNLHSALAPRRGQRNRAASGLAASRNASAEPRTLEDRRLLAFSPAANYAVGAGPQAVVSGYFNNDTVLDLAVANASSDTMSVLLGNGDGTFQAAHEFGTGAGPHSVAVGDIDGDGKLDLATANAYDVSVLLGNGEGGFGDPTSIDLGLSLASLAVGDFNADGRLDLGVTSNVGVPSYDYYGYYYTSYEGRATVLLGNGADPGLFSDSWTVTLGGGFHNSAAVADFNRDGNDDFATVNSDYGWATVLLGANAGAPCRRSDDLQHRLVPAGCDGG